MTNAAIYFHPEAFNTATQSLMGRHAAGESFMRGFLRHADVDRFHIWNIAGRAQPGLEELLNRLHPPERPVNWIDMRNRPKVGEVGVANLPIPEIGKEAWQRAPFGPNTYAICGITHTTATATVMNAVADMLIAPTEAFDTLICTSSAVSPVASTTGDSVYSMAVPAEASAAAVAATRRAPRIKRMTTPSDRKGRRQETPPGN